MDNKAKQITGTSLVVGTEAPSRARQILKENDVIVSMTRPNLNAVALIPRELDDEICSTGFAVLRAKPFVLPSYIFHYVRTKTFISATSAAVAGALYPAITATFLRSLPLPLPPLEEQRRIVGLLDRAAEIRRRADAARAKARAIVPALFLDTFGDPVTNSKGWPVVDIGDLVGRIDGGWSPTCGEGTPARDEWGVLKLSAVKSTGFDANQAKPLPNPADARPELAVRDGDLLLTRKNTLDLVGTAAVVSGCPPRRMLPDTVFRLVPAGPDSFQPEYLCTLINLASFRPVIRQLASGSAASMPGISKGRLLRLKVQVPPITLQVIFAEQVQRLESLACHLDAAAAKAGAMAAALSAEVFGGTATTTRRDAA